MRRPRILETRAISAHVYAWGVMILYLAAGYILEYTPILDRSYLLEILFEMFIFLPYFALLLTSLFALPVSMLVLWRSLIASDYRLAGQSAVTLIMSGVVFAYGVRVFVML